jgi:hypothetical protein
VTCLAHSKLTALQVEVLEAFFQRERGFFLTGGAALAGFHLGHRATDDLDLFTTEQPAFERGRHVLADVAAALGGELQVRQDAPGFKRLVLTRGAEGVVIDLVRDVSPQRHRDKLERDNLVIDPADEIARNGTSERSSVSVGSFESREPIGSCSQYVCGGGGAGNHDRTTGPGPENRASSGHPSVRACSSTASSSSGEIWRGRWSMSVAMIRLGSSAPNDGRVSTATRAQRRGLGHGAR